MNDNIRAGDFVEVVKWPCCGKFLGHRFVVSKIGRECHRRLRCWCGIVHPIDGDLFVSDETVPQRGDYLVKCFAAWVKKIPPLTEPESTERKEEANA